MFETESLEATRPYSELISPPMNVSESKPVHILSLSNKEKREFLNSFDYVLSDCDGVIWDLETAIEGSGEAINLLKEAGKRLVYVTNNSIRSNDNYLNQFKAVGVEIELDDIIHPVRSIIEYLKLIKFEGLIYCIATTTFINLIKEAGFQVINGPDKILEESFTELARNVFDKEPVRAIIMDVDFNLSATKLIRAQQYLTHPDCFLIAGATDTILSVRKNINIIGPGSFLKILVETSGKSPSVLGKPGWDLGQIVMKRYGIENPERVLIIGDMLKQDIAFGRICQFQTLVVLTGGCKESDLKKEKPLEETPHYYADSLADFKEFFQSIKNED